MSGYAAAFASVSAARLARGIPDIQVGILVAVRAASALGVPVTARGTAFAPIDAAFVLAKSEYFSVPGVRLREPIAAGTGMVLLSSPGPAAREGFAAELGKGILGADNLDFFAKLEKLWDKAGRSGIIDVASLAKVHLAVRSGLVALPIAGGTHPAWPGFVALAAPVWAAYVQGALATATALAEDASRAADFWAAVEAGVTAIRDAPVTLVTGGVSFAGRVIGGLGAKNLLLFGGIGLVLAAWRFGPALLARKGKK